MANRIRRRSMERLELYDLEKLTSDQQFSSPPLPPPRKHRRHLPADFAFQRYQFLCDMTRHRTDPVYAATPMFRIIPQTKPIRYRQQIFGRRIPSSIVTPRLTKLTEPQSAETDDEEEEEEEEEEESSDEDEPQESDSDDDDDGGGGPSSSSSSSSSSDHDDDYLDDNANGKGIVEQIFNRNQRKN